MLTLPPNPSAVSGNDYLCAAIHAPNTIEMLELVSDYTHSTTIQNPVFELAAELGNFKAYEWAAKRTYDEDGPSIENLRGHVQKALARGQVDFLDQLRLKYGGLMPLVFDRESESYTSLISSSFATLDPRPLEWLIKNCGVKPTCDFESFSEFLQVISNKKDIDPYWDYLVSKGFVLDRAQLDMARGSDYAYYGQTRGDLDVSLRVLKFFHKIGFHPNDQDIRVVLPDLDYDALVWAYERYPNEFLEEHVRNKLHEVARKGRARNFRFLCNKFPSALNEIMTMKNVVEFVSRNHVTILDVIYELVPQSIDWHQVFSQASFAMDYDVMRFSHWTSLYAVNGFDWLADHVLEPGEEVSQFQVMSATTVRFFDWMVERGLTGPSDFAVLIRSNKSIRPQDAEEILDRYQRRSITSRV